MGASWIQFEGFLRASWLREQVVDDVEAARGTQGKDALRATGLSQKSDADVRGSGWI